MRTKRLRDILFVLAMFGLVAAVLRMGKGLGATTALSDEIPWGLWKVVNMIAGVALATGGFVLAFCVHVLHINTLRPILRPALVVAFLGYGSSCAALMFDIGLPWRFWHPMVYWNPHSFLFEVFWCVLLYFTMTALEVSPIALESSKFKRVYALVRKIGAPVVIVGITLSTLHHSSLGSLFLTGPTRLHEIWYTPWLPVLFIVSAVGAGMLSVVLLTIVTARLYRREPPTAVLSKVGGAAAIVLSLYFVIRFVDFARRGTFGALTNGQWEADVFWIEILMAAVIPVALLAVPKFRRSLPGLTIAGTFAVLGLVLNRVDVGILGYFRSGDTVYVPTLAEIALTLGIPSAAGLFYLWFIERFRVFQFGESLAPLPEPVTTFNVQTGVWNGVFLDNLERLSLIAVVLLPVALVLFTPGATAGEDARAVVAPRGVGELRETLSIDGNRNGQAVLFPHEAHKARLGGDESCAECHHLDRPGDNWSSCHGCHSQMDHASTIFNHEFHVERIAAKEGFMGALGGNRTCSGCHEKDRPHSRESAKACVECHATDMRMVQTDLARPDLAPSYRVALHESCVGCHEERAEEAGKPELGDCSTCHKE